MPIKIEHNRDGRVVVFTMADPLTMDEFAPAILENEAYMDEHLPHSVIDAVQLTTLPLNILSFIFRQTNSAKRMSTPGSAYTFIATRSQTLRVMVSVVRHLIPLDKMVLVESVEEAWAGIDAILEKEVSPE